MGALLDLFRFKGKIAHKLIRMRFTRRLIGLWGIEPWKVC